MFHKIIIGMFVSTSLIGYNPQRIETIEPKITFEQHMATIFGKKSKVAIAVLKHESQLKLDSVNYNCRYNGRSTFCKRGDESKAWSVDCGIGQINVKGKTCPQELLTLEGNMKAVERIYKTQGLGAWCSYNSGAYKKYL